MAQQRGMIEIRLDRRQAFYAFVGCMLIVSVAFVVGLIVGQRMQLVELPGGPRLALDERASDGPAAAPGRERSSERSGGDDLALLPAEEAQPEQPAAPEDFTFYDALNRPRIELEPARVRPLAREAEQAAAAEPEQVAAAEPEPAREERARPEPRVEPVAPRAAAREPAPAPAPRVAEVPEPAAAEVDDSTRAVPRRVRRVGDRPGAGGVEEFGYFIVEAGRFETYEAAEEVRARIAARGRTAAVSLLGGDGPRRFRVEVGDGFSRRSDAESVADEVGGRVVREG